ncbi:MAG: 2-oxoacid:acceptor oxidoreductase family protein [SAR324 cluster bacterium]|jgi:2-oxoglutarate ferredoxin oxidoreductase subunit gamma|nr:2-oxoacid:acceptor oxidoreductase family protein [SAR324 cluster bacterium]MEE1576172.1 2-oxoacid:acceptor oxidoreductase family protein [Deltaproteobacteria bacterium]MDP6245043.1 2-oxoacid:acceptor oxidoreductase family protein [SAR324 cluster bacterium]MDP6465151.1 2-oxoacid:acceptor oxidoreductase family protein [SAR324 cluster bacterium]MDP7139549.1 2-oxoacid:acceptor oxidoreductase family protein [SAR324 cluster bacterium]|tara:strand:- start:2485 stop:3048 length:564 start_codon:yes stop_codon:yes gene_type:complete
MNSSKNMNPLGGKELQIRLGGAGGQGLQLCAALLTQALALEGKHVSQSQSYEPTSRGGLSRSDIVVADQTPDFPLVTDLDLLLLLDQLAVESSMPLLKKEGTVLVDSKRVPELPQGAFRCRSFPFVEKARELGNERIANMIGLGALCGISSLCARKSLETTLKQKSPSRFLELNLSALDLGFAMALS